MKTVHAEVEKVNDAKMKTDGAIVISRAVDSLRRAEHEQYLAG